MCDGLSLELQLSQQVLKEQGILGWGGDQVTEAESEVMVINPAVTSRLPKGVFQGVLGTKVQGGQGLPLTGTRDTAMEDSGSSLAQSFACGRRF